MYVCPKFVVFRTDLDEKLSEFHEMLMIYKLSDTNNLRTLNFQTDWNRVVLIKYFLETPDFQGLRVPGPRQPWQGSREP